MKLIFVHGRGQGTEDEQKLKNQWIETLKKGLAKSGLELPIAESDVKFPFYGKILDQMILQYGKPVKSIVKKGAEGENMHDARFVHDLLKEVSVNAKITTKQIEIENPEQIINRGPLNWGWVQAILRALDEHTAWGEKSIKKFTRDVFLYLTVPAIKEKINEMVTDAFEDEPCVVVGHSLGSIVCYNVLRDSNSFNVCKFITVGSPLGLKAVKNYLKTPIIMPPCVKNGWYNAFDDRDVVALNALNEEYFDVVPAIENKSDVDNHTKNRHGIVGYLDDKDIARQIYDALVNGC